MRAQLAWWTTLLVGLLLQTTFLSHLLPHALKPDFSRSLVLWLALTGLPGGGAWYAFAAGLLVDLLSGAPMGFTGLTRLAIYGAARPGRNVLERSALVFLLGPLSVVLEGAVTWILRATLFVNAPDPFAFGAILFKQALVEVVTVPVIFVIMELASGYRTEWGARFDPR